MDIVDVKVSRGGLAVLTNKDGSVYSWGPNDAGQLGRGDYQSQKTPHRVKTIQKKYITQVAVGDDFAVALGQTFPIMRLQDQLKENDGLSKKSYRLDNPNKTRNQFVQ